jgi:hypothetical protein
MVDLVMRELETLKVGEENFWVILHTTMDRILDSAHFDE